MERQLYTSVRISLDTNGNDDLADNRPLSRLQIGMQNYRRGTDQIALEKNNKLIRRSRCLCKLELDTD